MSGIYTVIMYLIAFTIMRSIWSLGREGAQNFGGKGKSFYIMLGKGLLVCVAIAFVVAAGTGSSSCSETEYGVSGGSCEIYNDDGFTPTMDQYLRRFILVLSFFYGPYLLGFVSGNNGGKSENE